MLFKERCKSTKKKCIIIRLSRPFWTHLLELWLIDGLRHEPFAKLGVSSTKHCKSSSARKSYSTCVDYDDPQTKYTSLHFFPGYPFSPSSNHQIKAPSPLLRRFAVVPSRPSNMRRTRKVVCLHQLNCDLNVCKQVCINIYSTNKI